VSKNFDTKRRIAASVRSCDGWLWAVLVCVACVGCGAAGSGGGTDAGAATTASTIATSSASASPSVDPGAVVAVGQGPVGLAADSDGSVWVAQAGASSVSRIRGGKVDLEVKGIDVPLRLAAADGSVWATAFGTGELVRISATNLTTEQEAVAWSKAVLPEFPDSVFTLQPKQGQLFQQCPVWDVKDADASMMNPVVSDVPVLILEGTFDSATAPSWVDLITPGLKANQLVSMPFTGHAVYGKSACAAQIAAGFLANPTQPVDQACTAQATRPFVTS